MKLSTAIDIGRKKVDDQLHGSTFKTIEGKKGACALGCAYLGVNDYDFETVENMLYQDVAKDLIDNFTELGVLDKKMGFDLFDQILDKNDEKGESLDEIINWLKSQNL